MIESSNREKQALPCLSELLAPFDAARFLEEVWEQRPLHVPAEDPTRFEGLLGFGELDQLLALLEDCRDLFVVNYDQQAEPVDYPDDHVPRVQALFDVFSRGYSLVINQIPSKWPAVRELSRRLSAESGFGNYINLYVTPPNATAFHPHWDHTDVLVLQLSGEKQWSLFESGPDLPYFQQTTLADTQAQVVSDPGPVGQSLLMKAGDVLYMPRGCVHQAVATAEGSMHITIGLKAPTWADVWREAIRQRAHGQRDLRRTVPFGWHQAPAQNLMAALPALAGDDDPSMNAATVANFKQHLFREMPSPQDGLFAKFGARETLGLLTWLEKRHQSLWSLETIGEQFCLSYPGFNAHGPRKLGWALDAILQQARFRPADLPTFLSETERLTLCRHLMRRGFLRVCSNQAEEAAP